MKQKTFFKYKKSKNKNAGFTIIETVVASLIMLVGVVAVMNLFVLAKVANQSSKQSVLATSLAKRKIEELLALPLSSTSLAYSAAATTSDPLNEQVTGYFENYYLDSDRGATKGTWQLSKTPFYTNQPAAYVVTWRIDPDNVLNASNQPTLPGMLRIQVRARALVNSGGSAAAEVAELSTIRTPPSN